jgi:hypothetical protein
MVRMACTEPQCLYKGALIPFKKQQETKHKELRAVPEVSETMQQFELEFCKTHTRVKKRSS